MKVIATLVRVGALSMLWLAGLPQAYSEDLSGYPLTYMGKELERSELKTIGEIDSRPMPDMTRYLTVTRRPYNNKCGTASGKVDRESYLATCPDVRDLKMGDGTNASFFNNNCNVTPQEMVVSGFEVRLEDSGVWRQLWERLNSKGKPLGDIARLVIYADKVILASPLHVPGGDVVIHARQLVFEKDGQIDTTPNGDFAKCKLAGAIWCKPGAEVIDKEIQGVLVHACSEGLMPYRGRGYDGIDGSLGGDIALAVGEVSWGDSTLMPRLIVNGGNGSMGGEGIDGLNGTQVTIDLPQGSFVSSQHDPGRYWEGSYADSICPSKFDTRKFPHVVTTNNLLLCDPDFTLVSVPDYVRKHLPNTIQWISEGLCGPPFSSINIGKAPIPSFGSLPIMPMRSVGTTQTKNIWGRNVLPIGGYDALPEGYSGAGGGCGAVLVYGNIEFDAHSVDGHVGHPGGTRGTIYLGGKQLQCADSEAPCYVYRISFSCNPRTDADNLITTYPSLISKGANSLIYGGESYRVRGGKLVYAPQCNAIQFLYGRLKLSPLQLRPVIEYVKDLYLFGRVGDALKITKDYLVLIEADLSLRKEMSEEDRASFAASEQELAGLKLRLEAGLDYFGNPFGYVPNLSFAVLLSQYRQQVSRYIESMALGIWMQQYELDALAKQQHFEEIMEHIQDELKSDSQQFENVATKIGPLQSLAADVKTRQASVEQKLLWLEQDFARSAQGVVDARYQPEEQDGVRAFLHKAAAIAKVIPIYQPTLGAVASGIEMATRAKNQPTVDIAVKLFQTYKGLSDMNVREESMRSISAFREQVLSSTENIETGIQKVASGAGEMTHLELWNHYASALNADAQALKSGFSVDKVEQTVSNIKTGNILNTVAEFNNDEKNGLHLAEQGLSQTRSALKGLQVQFGQFQNQIDQAMNDQIPQRAPIGEVQKELELLKANSEEFRDAKASLKDLVQKKAELYQQYTESLSHLHELSTRLHNEMAELTENTNFRDTAIAEQEHELSLRVRAMTQRTRDRMLRYLYDLSKAYEYFMVKPSPIDLDVVSVSDKLMNVITAKSGEPTGAKSIALSDVKKDLVKALFSENENNLIKKIDSLTAQMEPSEVILELTTADLAALRESGEVSINLGDRLYKRTENLHHERHKNHAAFRIQNVSATYVSFEEAGDYNIVITPGGESVLSDPTDFSGSRLLYFRHCVMSDELSCKTGIPPIKWSINLGVDPNGDTYIDHPDPLVNGVKHALCGGYNQSLDTCNWNDWVALPSLFSTVTIHVSTIPNNPNFKNLKLKVSYFYNQ